MNTQNNGPSLTGVVDIIANSISLFEDNGTTKNINDIFINKNDISTAEPYDVQIDETGNNFITMYQFNGDIPLNMILGMGIYVQNVKIYSLLCLEAVYYAGGDACQSIIRNINVIEGIVTKPQYVPCCCHLLQMHPT